MPHGILFTSFLELTSFVVYKVEFSWFFHSLYLSPLALLLSALSFGPQAFISFLWFLSSAFILLHNFIFLAVMIPNQHRSLLPLIQVQILYFQLPTRILPLSDPAASQTKTSRIRQQLKIKTQSHYSRVRLARQKGLKIFIPKRMWRIGALHVQWV